MRKTGLYIHVPFRIHKHNHRGTLSFCNMDFNIISYFKHLKREIELRKDDNIIIDSIYIGGGDPSSMNSDYIVDILEHIYKNFNVEENCEKTIELDPLVPEFRLKNYIKYGINRFSIKAYTFDKRGLEYLDISHDKNDIRNLVKLIRKYGMNNINLDMYFAYPGQTVRSLERDFVLIERLNIPHVSFYSFLNYEDMYAIYHSKEEIELSNSLEDDMLDAISYVMANQGYEHYEINHFAKDGMRSYHNQKYWKLEDYMGVGLGASGLVNNELYRNQINFEKYFSDIDSGKVPYLDFEDLSKEEFEKNYIISKMGMIEGINIEYVNERFGIDFLDKYNTAIEKNVKDNIVQIKDGRLIFTEKGMYLSNKFYLEII